MDMNLSKLQEMVRDKEAWYATVHRFAKSWTRLGPWTTVQEGSLSDGSKRLFYTGQVEERDMKEFLLK